MVGKSRRTRKETPTLENVASRRIRSPPEQNAVIPAGARCTETPKQRVGRRG